MVMRFDAVLQPERMNPPLEIREIRLRGLAPSRARRVHRSGVMERSRQSAQADFVCLLQRIHSPGGVLAIQQAGER
jgi:hypothetical protein